MLRSSTLAEETYRSRQHSTATAAGQQHHAWFVIHTYNICPHYCSLDYMKRAEILYRTLSTLLRRIPILFSLKAPSTLHPCLIAIENCFLSVHMAYTQYRAVIEYKVDPATSRASNVRSAPDFMMAICTKTLSWAVERESVLR